MEITSIDQLGTNIRLPFPPRRIISLVPSQTEFLFDLGLDKQICGITKFCIHPRAKTKAVPKIGGTKKFNIEGIRQLNPDLIIGNKEENYEEGIRLLQAEFPVWMSDIITLKSAYEMMSEVALITDRENEGQAIIRNIEARFFKLIPLKDKLRVAYLIWQDPFMVAASGTFINEMLKSIGLVNVFEDRMRYPKVTITEIQQAGPDLIFLSSEPYPFTSSHAAQFQVHFPEAQIRTVNGEFFSWYGSRLLLAVDYFDQLIKEISGK